MYVASPNMQLFEAGFSSARIYTAANASMHLEIWDQRPDLGFTLRFSKCNSEVNRSCIHTHNPALILPPTIVQPFVDADDTKKKGDVVMG